MRIGPYSLHGTIAAGGFGQVDYATVDDGNGLTKLVAVKRMRADRANDEALAMLADEARLVSRIRHPNVIGVLDVLQHDAELFVVMEYVDGETLAFFLRRAQRKNDPIPLPIVSAIVVGALEGLHAAHEAVDEDGAPLGIVHRDVSLPNIMVGADGLSRILDFGVAKAEGRQQSTVVGELKGKLAYMAPEQLALEPVTPRSDVYAVGVVLWELIASRRLFDSPDGAVTISKVLKGEIEPPSKYASGVPEALEILVIRALSRDPADRFASGAEMAAELAACVAPASTNEVAAWVGAASVDSTTKKPPGVGKRAQQATMPDIEIEMSEQTINESVAQRGRRRRLMITLVTTGLLVVVGAIAVGAVTKLHAQTPPETEEPAEDSGLIATNTLPDLSDATKVAEVADASPVAVAVPDPPADASMTKGTRRIRRHPRRPRTP